MSHRLLLVDDEPHILRAAEFKFRRAGYEVVCASDGEEAWEELLDGVFDMVITDCQMPHLDGVGLVARMRSHPQTMDTPIVMLTAKKYELSREELASKYGVLEILAKPFSPRALLRLVDTTLADAAGVVSA